MMIYLSLIIIIVVLILLALVVVFLHSYNEYKTKNDLEETIDEEQAKYQEEKYKKIKAQYYRSIEIEEKQQDQNYTIVGFDKPKGKWTQMIMMQNMKYMMTLKSLMGSNFSKLGIWQLKLKAQSLISHGFHKGKGR